MFENGKVFKPFLLPHQHGGTDAGAGFSENGEESKEGDDSIGKLQKRVVVAPPKVLDHVKKERSLISNFVLLNQTKRQQLKEEKDVEMQTMPQPPPKGWEMLLHKPSGKM